jgi:hypothetical protein
MAINRTLVWILAGGAALALGGAAIWWWRRRAKTKARGEQLEPQPPHPGQDIPPIADPLDLEIHPQAVPHEQTETKATRKPPARGPVVARELFRDLDHDYVTKAVSKTWPTRPHGPELEPELGDDIAFIVKAREPETQPYQLELLVGRIQTITETKLDVDVQGAVSSKGVGSMRVDHGYAAGDRVEIEPRHIAEVIKPEPPTVLVPKSRRKRYRVGVGDLIELRPDTITELPADSAWQPSRPDVAVRVVEQDQARSVVALDGPAGEVNVALQTPAADGKVRTLCSWKFQIVEKAA